MKKIIILLAFCFFSFGTLNVNASTNSWCFGFDSDTGTITNYKSYSLKCPWNVEIPEKIDNISVKRIGAKAFMNDGIDSVVIPSTINYIGPLAFASNNLSSINIPNSVTKIGYGAFNNNPVKGNNFIYSRSDSNNDGVAEIDKTTLISVASLSTYYNYINVKIPNTVKKIDQKAFYGMFISRLDLSNVETLNTNALVGSLINTIKIPKTLSKADFTIDNGQIPYKDVIYFKFKDENNKDYAFTSGKEMYVNSSYYEQPELIHSYGAVSAYNKLSLTWILDGDVDGVEVYKYNSSNKKYEYFTRTTSKNGISITKSITVGNTYYFKVRSYKTTPDKKTYYSNFSNPIKLTPQLNKPIIKAKKYRSGVARISWKKVPGANGYALYKYNKSKKKYEYVKSVTKLSTNTKYKLKARQSTYYKVRAYKIINGKRVYSPYSKASWVRV